MSIYRKPTVVNYNNIDFFNAYSGELRLSRMHSGCDSGEKGKVHTATTTASAGLPAAKAMRRERRGGAKEEGSYLRHLTAPLPLDTPNP